MRVASEQQNSELLALLPDTEFEPILVQDAGRDRAVLLSSERYQELAHAAIAEFSRISEAVSRRVEAAGITEQDVEDMLAEMKAERIRRR